MTPASKEELRRRLRENLRKFRGEEGYSQEEVAQLLGVSRPTYTYYETGKTSPDPVTLGKIARICGAPIEFFFEEEDTPNRPLFLTDRERCPKKPFPNPNKIGELTPDEKKLIALLRTSQTVSASETANWVIAQRESRNDR